jgi:hypothetical protein
MLHRDEFQMFNQVYLLDENTAETMPDENYCPLSFLHSDYENEAGITVAG